jgi:predicted enzyme related to lactoylglutathione lyase
MLDDSLVTANVPAGDLERARSFYADKLGLTPARENPGGLIYTTTGGTTFFLYETAYAGQAGHTIAQWHVADVAAEVEELKARGVAFEHYDLPGVSWDGDVASMGEMGKAAWFTDSEGNIMCIDDMMA